MIEHDADGAYALQITLVRGRKESRAARELAKLADRRVYPGPVRLGEGRRMTVEAVEELADCRNYVWWAVAAGVISPERGAQIMDHLNSAYRLISGCDPDVASLVRTVNAEGVLA